MMKKLLSLLLCLCLMPLTACAERMKTFGMTEAELDMLLERHDQLLSQTAAELPSRLLLRWHVRKGQAALCRADL